MLKKAIFVAMLTSFSVQSAQSSCGVFISDGYAACSSAWGDCTVLGQAFPGYGFAWTVFDNYNNVAYESEDGGDPYSCEDSFSVPPPTPPALPPGPTATGCGSIISVDNQALGEEIPIVGTSFDLVYFSDRVSGRAQAFTSLIPITNGDSLSGLTGVDLTVTYAGRTSTQSFTTAANQNYTFNWDGLDSSANIVPAPINAQVSIVYNGFETQPFTYSMLMGVRRSDTVGLGGWSPSILHYYDVNNQQIYYGDGSFRQVPASLYNSGSQYIAGNDNGSELYVFDLTGKHLHTLNGLTGAVLYTFAYDTNNHLTTITDSYSNVTTINRDMSGVLTGITSPYGQATSFTLDTNGYLAMINNPNGESYAMTYSGTGGLLSTFQKPRGQTSTMTYDSSGFLTLDSNSAGNSTALSQGLDPSSGIPEVTSTSNLGIATEYLFTSTQPYERLQDDPDGTQNETVFNSNTQVSTITYGVGQVTNYTTDERLGAIANFPVSIQIGNGDSDYVKNSTQSMGTWTQTGATNSPLFFNYSYIDTQNTINSNLWDSKYTLSTGETVVTSPGSRKTYYWTDTYGKLTESQLATYSPTYYSYDSHGRLSGTSQNMRSNTIAYNSSGFISSITDALSAVTSFTYDGAGRVLTETLPDSRVVTNTYDLNGNLTSVTPASSNTHSFTFNLFDLISEYLPPALTGFTVNTTYAYNNDQKLTQITRPDGHTAVYSYDPTTGHLINVVIPSGTYTYTSLGQMLDTAESADGITNDFSNSGTQVLQDYVNTYRPAGISFAYNNDFNLSSTTVSPYSGSSSAITYTYNTDALMTAAGSETITRSSTTGQVTNTSLTKIKDVTAYDSNYGEVSSYVAVYSPSPIPSPIMSEGFTRDALGRISAESISLLGAAAVPYGYTYDAAGRLTTVSQSGSSYSSYTYDNNSNRISGTLDGTAFTATFDAEDRMLTFNTKTYTYTVNGDLATIVDSSLPSGHQTTTFSFDELGNLKQVVTPTTTVSYAMDGINRRVQKTNGSTVEATYLYHNKTQVEAVMTSAGAVSERFVYGTKANVPDYLVKSGTTYKIISDERGSVRFVINAGTGAIAHHIEYNEFGLVLSDTSPGFQPFYFAGCLYDQDTKLCHFGAREYDPSTGRWLSKDPILFKGSDTNLYGYTLNDPVNNIDSSGTGPVLYGICVAASGVGIGVAESQWKNAINSKIAALQAEITADQGLECQTAASENEIKIAQAEIQNLRVQYATGAALIASGSIALGAACNAALAAPTF